MRKIAVITGNRAEYGVLKNIIKKIDNDNELELELIVTGAHLSDKYGKTVNEILNDGFKISYSIPILMDSNNETSIAKEMGLLMIQLSQVLEKLKPDIILILGDRYEIFAVATTAMVMNIPIAHISGGEITEGAMDEQIRHAITKMAHIHFPGAECYAENIKNMGEEKFRIFNVGDPGIENIKLTKLLTKEEMFNDLGVNVDEDTLLVAYHPVTLELNDLEKQINNLISALDRINKKMIITYPNADCGGKIIIDKLEDFKKHNSNVYLYKNLGSLKFLSAMNLCGVIVGNSSSALVEAPFLKKPVVNIGNRQKGRLMADNIICCDYEIDNMEMAINRAMSKEFKDYVKNINSLYGEGNTSSEIVKVLKEIDLCDNFLKKKLFWS
ncbi:GDP/UDP-N,N'-diacetylbacillosamine 2-epimerase (hydrolysing) [Clostridium cavendishii DSM 21758]|uniref:GDP/UDP-N,N'-diacetylbacillosamine 2-epimerase (Hydrolysing) n=1 Tax=Clostridium cavendishii DSM 21758 TaxID=1121302 RepID=A0A1M6QB78_9CLOT|nr:UDP-N-acetylglucosamine 2-epimerase [Clostridium cavendishii]SHK17353.1 GDP/UDP-N,N'-diacetylbacillosamine 2-epimerase (hydrolysing) [Clostridium cavendishii DSM 21758]